MPGSRSDCARNALPVDPVVVRRRLRAMERSLRILRSLRARGRDAFLSDEGRFRVDRDGVQIGHKMLLVQWQDGRRVIVWPEELAPDKPRFPTPPWSQRP